MGKNNFEHTSRIAVFRAAEESPGEPSETSGVSLDLDSGSGLKSTLAVAHNNDTIHGSELPTRMMASHRETTGTLVQKAAKPDFLAFVLAGFFGGCQSSQPGTNSYAHAISPVSGLDLPSFTCVQRRGADIFTERISGNYIEGFTLELGEGWVSLSADVIGTGKRETNYAHEVVSAPADSSSITLAANGVEGAAGSERLTNVYRVRAKDAGSDAWQVLSVSAVSADAPAQISFEQALGQSGDSVDFHVDYLPVEPSWCTLPDPVDESPMKLIEARVVVDGFYDGEDLVGGEELRAEVKGFVIAGKNNLELSHFPGDSGPAARAVRGGRELTVSLTESLRDTVRQYQADNPETETLALALDIRGAEIDPGVYFGARIIFPRCGILAAPVVVQGKRLAQAGDLVVMDDGAYDGVIIHCYNLQSGYL